MNAKRITTSLLVILAVTVLVVLAFHIRIGATADSVAVLRTTGMTCGRGADPGGVQTDNRSECRAKCRFIKGMLWRQGRRLRRK